MSRKIIAGNWKLNLLPKEAFQLIKEIVAYCDENNPDRVSVVIAPPIPYVRKASKLSQKSRVNIAAQNCSEHKSGAYTGEVSAEMIKGVGAKLVIIGHSERRLYFGETDQSVNTRLKMAFAARLMPILCVGESLEDRKAGNHKEVVKNQLTGALEGISQQDADNLVVAYEPVWAIGTGETATPKQAQEMHLYIRSYLAKLYNSSIAQDISVLYGGSVKPENARDIFCQPDVDGGLIGGASLKAELFNELIRIGNEVLR